MTTHQARRRPAVWALPAVTLAAVLGGLTAPVAVADPAPSGGKLVLVLDASGSMAEPAGDGQTKIGAARAALTSVVTKLPEGAEVGLRVYGATVFKRTQAGACTDSQLTVPIATGNRPQLQAAIAKYKPYGETPIAYALQEAAKDLGPVGQRTIVLVSDGEATCAPEPCAVAKSIAKQGIDLKIDVVGFRVGGKARSQLQCVARAGRGDYYDADSTIDLEAGLDRLSTRAFRPFRFSGKPVQGALQQEGAPLLAPGQYLDTFGTDRAAKYYTIKRTMAKSTLRAGISFRRPTPGGTVIEAAVKLNTLTGESCGWSYPLSFENEQGIATGSASSWVREYPKECETEEQLVLMVSGGKNFAELKDAPYELRIDEEPAVESTSNLPAEAGDPTWASMQGTTPREIVPGSSFADAPLVEPGGSYKTTVMPGEVQLYKVKADWGQRIQGLVTVPQLDAATTKAVDINHYLDLDVISPIGEDVYAVFAKKVPGGAGKRGVLQGTGTVKGITTKEIRYLNRNGPNNQDTGTSLPGDYYIAISMSRTPDDKPFTIPLTLTVGVVGTAGAGKPAYVNGETPVSGESVTPTPSSTPSAETPETGGKNEAGGPVQGRSDGNGTGDETPIALVTGLAGGGLLLLLAGAFTIVRLKQKPAAAQWQPPHNHPNPHSNQGAQEPPSYPNQSGPQPPPNYPNQGGPHPRR